MDVLPFKLGFVEMFIVSCMTHFIPIYSMVISCIFFFWTDTHKSTSRKKTWLTSVIFFVWSDPLTPRKSPWNPSKWVLRDPPPSAWRLKPKSTRPKMTSAASRKLVHSWYAMGPWGHDISIEYTKKGIIEMHNYVHTWYYTEKG